MSSKAKRVAYCSTCGSEIDSDAELCPECGVRQGTAQHQQKEPTDRYIAAAIGAVVSFVIGWFPLIGPIVPGVVAGYLRGENTKESAITGTLANVIASIPIVLVLALFFGLGALGTLVEGNGEAALGFGVLLIMVVISFVYYFGFGALGGVIGAELSDRGEPE
ncbi:DUF5518 domain-containing protein [Natrarchaeobius chitinivorans]|uniref:Zinc ribbon domain-containing protein n=1 Tax=Natrarchaeobius chitinivorans TaxID=1679083 RepID=A0A3N6MET1_NATCH|nr:DUF5518 domain-containing protein [Natrarchaeobius chitinivorans]RQG95190.1 zinc ribbon domain-containing protein [Natrarchaeobius chitinivorans]